MKDYNKLKTGTVLILKKDFPPFPIGTEFTVSYGCVNEIMLHTPTFGTILNNGEKIPSMSVKTYYEYGKIFEAFGGVEAWFDIKPEMEIEEWSSHCIKFKGKHLTKDLVDKIQGLIY